MKKGLILLVAVLVVGLLGWLLFKPPTSKPSATTPVVVAFENDIPLLDPCRLQDAFALRVGYQIAEGLTKLGPTNEIAPAVADNWENSPDFTRWTFHLRPGVSFHPHPANGNSPVPVTAEDVVFSFTRMLAADAVTAGPLAGVIAGATEFKEGKAKAISGIRVVSQAQIEFTLSRPDSLFPGRISSPAYAIVSQKAVEAAGKEFGQTTHCGTGPFRFVERRGNEVVLARFEGYWQKSVASPVSGVVFRTIKEDALRLAEARAGKVSVTYATPAMLEGLVEKTPGAVKLTPEAARSFQQTTSQIFNTYFLAFNYPKIHPDLRRAIALAIDREEVIAAAVPTSGIPAAGPVPLACSGYQALVQPARNLDAARKSLEAFKQANPGATAKIRILVHELAQAVPIGTVVQSQLRPLGIEVELVQQSFNAVLDAVRKGDFDATVLGFEYQYSLPQLILENFYTSAAVPLPNVFHYKNPENDAAIAALFAKAQGPSQLSEVAEIEKAMVNEAPGVFIYQTTQTLLIDPKLEGVTANGANFTDLTQAHWK